MYVRVKTHAHVQIQLCHHVQDPPRSRVPFTVSFWMSCVQLDLCWSSLDEPMALDSHVRCFPFPFYSHFGPMTPKTHKFKTLFFLVRKCLRNLAHLNPFVGVLQLHSDKQQWRAANGNVHPNCNSCLISRRWKGFQVCIAAQVFKCQIKASDWVGTGLSSRC